MTSCQPTIMLANGNLIASKNAHHAHIPKKTETMSYVAPILLAQTGAKSFLYLSV
jgi:hypothetical protein